MAVKWILSVLINRYLLSVYRHLSDCCNQNIDGRKWQEKRGNAQSLLAVKSSRRDLSIITRCPSWCETSAKWMNASTPFRVFTALSKWVWLLPCGITIWRARPLMRGVGLSILREMCLANSWRKHLNSSRGLSLWQKTGVILVPSQPAREYVPCKFGSYVPLWSWFGASFVHGVVVQPFLCESTNCSLTIFSPLREFYFQKHMSTSETKK